MEIALLLAPDFALIALGALAVRIAKWETSFWEPLEKLTYFVLFPALLFYSNAKSTLDAATAVPLLAGLGLTIVGAIALALIGRWLLRPRVDVFAATFQCAFRFNAYIALSLVGRLYGDAGLAFMALAIGVGIPVTNLISIWGLAQGGSIGIVRAFIGNPLVISSAAGIVWGAAGWPIPEAAAIVCNRCGGAALVLGLLTVGAALRFDSAREFGTYPIYILVVKLVGTPAIAWLLIPPLGLTGAAAAALLLFTASPCPSNAYVLAARLGGNGRVVALVVSASILLSVLSLPPWIATLR